jgi:hypothetical protein
MSVLQIEQAEKWRLYIIRRKGVAAEWLKAILTISEKCR